MKNSFFFIWCVIERNLMTFYFNLLIIFDNLLKLFYSYERMHFYDVSQSDMKFTYYNVNNNFEFYLDNRYKLYEHERNASSNRYDVYKKLFRFRKRLMKIRKSPILIFFIRIILQDRGVRLEKASLSTLLSSNGIDYFVNKDYFYILKSPRK